MDHPLQRGLDHVCLEQHSLVARQQMFWIADIDVEARQRYLAGMVDR